MTAALELVGVVGGTFDPVHVGHLHLARQVALAFALRRVLLVPCARQPNKPKGPVAGAADRLEMVRLAATEEPGCEASAIEVDRGGISYTFDTLVALRTGGITPLFVVGADSVADLTTWHEHDRLLREFDLVAIDRPGTPMRSADESRAASIARRIVPVPCRAGAGNEHRAGSGGRIFHLGASTIDVSSSRVRARVAAGEPIVGLVPAAVARYIQEHRLYLKEVVR